MQFSGSGLVAPCGMLFNKRYKKYHIGNIAETSFKELWQSERYWEVLDLIASEKFDARTMCGALCLQHKVNECLWSLKHEQATLEQGQGEPPMHVNFI
jgi:MoaA/NifB/PqqE/SkfB family radical SAM enzyme